ncbi:uncharacterized protein LOC135073700 isoform X1 [Ostrinia nubilalis]|uniref:uncharacterized protein LOC135073700 isoform X1 n=2 Tax=Ostrinia nubilalis TaxID=29057 RepID=UPI0030822335
MENPGTSDETNKISRFFFQVCRLIYLLGLPNFWSKDFIFSKSFITFYDSFTKIMNVTTYVFVVTEWGAFYTQQNLNEKQHSDRLVFCISHPILATYRLILTHHGEKLKELVYLLCLDLKEKVNDEKIEKDTIRKAIIYATALVGLCIISVVSYGIDAFANLISSDATFTTVVTAWPDVGDRSTLAGMARIMFYVIWWIFMSRVFGVYIIMISIIVALEHQYKNLGNYFRNLSKVFEQNLSPTEKEKKYEESLKVGIQLHAKTLKCIELAQASFGPIFGAQIILNTYVIVLLLFQMVSSERTLGNVLATIFTGLAMLLSTGFLMWSGGDITIEAASLSTDMYWSGWQNCQASTTGTRKLLALAMLQAQRPVMIKGLGVITISYPAYLSIVKSAYSVFSVLY